MISGVLTVTVELPTDDAPTTSTADQYLDLDAKRYGSIEAGSYLAWKPATSTQELGRKVVYAIDNATGTATTDFTPDVNGLYIFRRAIDVDTNSPGNDVSYDYVGYYYFNGKYYKLNDITLAANSVGTEGNLTAAPTVKYSKKVTKTVNKVPMTYDAASSRLAVYYDTNADPVVSQNR